jgi:ATP-binding cassette, subfamily B, bacterial
LAFSHTQQLDAMDCGPACLKMICDHYGREVTLQRLRERCYISRGGVSLAGIADAAEQVGFKSLAVKIRYDSTDEAPGLVELPLPAILHWEQKHFVVIHKISSSHAWIADPAHGLIKLPKAVFMASWCAGGDQGIALGLEPVVGYDGDADARSTSYSWAALAQYLVPHRRLLVQFMIGIMVGLLLQVMIPFLTQAYIDAGVSLQNMHFVTVILIAQFVLFISQVTVQFVQSWILLHVGRRVNVSLVTDFLISLMRLPLGYFDSKNVGDLIQRIRDNDRVESFLTGSMLNIFFSILSLIVFSIILAIYNTTIFFVFLLFSILYFGWIQLFMKRRKDLDYIAFRRASDNQNALMEMIGGMQEIKLQGSERKRRWQWLDIQAKLFRLQSKSLVLKQYQDFGGVFFNRSKDIVISFLSASAVISGDMSLGTMFAIQYIVGQLNAPFDQIIQFMRAAQDARISLDRMGEITDVTPEDDPHVSAVTTIPTHADIFIEKVSYAYSPILPLVLNHIDLTIPTGKVTAIVGVSGSGKTTLLKLLLGFYPPSQGKISIGHMPLAALDKRAWRASCGTVMQDGYIFSDTIAANIAESDEVIDFIKLDHALHIANIKDYVLGLPLSYKTMIGTQGSGVSQGQRQRILIARAVYKDPSYLFFDEATNALDATNEKTILANLNKFFEDKTVVVVAHRLSTVKNADQIIVMDQGRIAEIGTHKSLVAAKGKYWELVENQLDLE